MRDTFTFTNTEAGRALRDNVAEACKVAGREFKFTEETVAGFVLLTLEVGKRVDEGQIARAVKVSKGREYEERTLNAAADPEAAV